MGSNPAPDQMRTGTLALAVLEGCPAIRCPGHLEHAGGSLDALDAEAWPEAPGDEIVIELAEGQPVSVPIGQPKSSPVPVELTSPRVGRHALFE